MATPEARKDLPPHPTEAEFLQAFQFHAPSIATLKASTIVFGGARNITTGDLPYLVSLNKTPNPHWLSKTHGTAVPLSSHMTFLEFRMTFGFDAPDVKTLQASVMATHVRCLESGEFPWTFTLVEVMKKPNKGARTAPAGENSKPVQPLETKAKVSVDDSPLQSKAEVLSNNKLLQPKAEFTPKNEITHFEPTAAICLKKEDALLITARGLFEDGKGDRPYDLPALHVKRQKGVESFMAMIAEMKFRKTARDHASSITTSALLVTSFQPREVSTDGDVQGVGPRYDGYVNAPGREDSATLIYRSSLFGSADELKGILAQDKLVCDRIRSHAGICFDICYCHLEHGLWAATLYAAMVLLVALHTHRNRVDPANVVQAKWSSGDRRCKPCPCLCLKKTIRPCRSKLGAHELGTVKNLLLRNFHAAELADIRDCEANLRILGFEVDYCDENVINSDERRMYTSLEDWPDYFGRIY